MDAQVYIGDGIYAQLKDGQLILTTQNGHGVTNRIVFGSEEWIHLIEWVGQMTGKA